MMLRPIEATRPPRMTGRLWRMAVRPARHGGNRLFGSCFGCSWGLPARQAKAVAGAEFSVAQALLPVLFGIVAPLLASGGFLVAAGQ
jgi:hypothetical protein